MHPANERWRYIVTSSLIGMVHSQNDPWKSCEIIFALILILLMHLGGTFAHVTSTLLLGHVQNCDLILKWERNVFVEDLDCELTSPLGNDAFIALAPVPLNIFRSNSKFDENSERSSFKYIRPITTIFCTRHDSDTVVTCAKYRCYRLRIFYTRVFWIFIEFQIRSKYV